MNAVQTDFNIVYPSSYLPVVLDGIVLGYVEPQVAPFLVESLRAIKVQQNRAHELYRCVPMTLEIAYLKPGRRHKMEQEVDAEQEAKVDINYFFPGIFLSSQVSRFVRPVMNI
jgi:hypothetical protein